MLKQRIITASILFVLFLAALFGLPAIGWQVLVLLLMWLGAAEWVRLSGLGGRAALGYPVLTTALTAVIMWFDAIASAQASALLHLACYIPAVLFWMFVVPTWLISGWRTQNSRLMGVVGCVVLIPTGLALLDLRAFNPWVLLFAMTLVMMADISAYFAGKRYGKTKLAPAISPGKTWEGVFGALLGVSLYVIVVGWASGAYKEYPVFPSAVVAGWLWVGLAVIGDLFESAVKRQAGVKDSGTLLPGHGGLLDRIDALTSTLPFAAIALVLQRLE
ncbi:MAG: phosphatidate cytidylyltransferase [Gammaproteobacteria bacterium]|nr:phosphatidate cytidylyltransferase [Gammaproteobacteria bacterium]MBU1968762.1 phosphatidate cytidylyltransferase [Gammaproteobacteria bacterium]